MISTKFLLLDPTCFFTEVDGDYYHTKYDFSQQTLILLEAAMCTCFGEQSWNGKDIWPRVELQFKLPGGRQLKHSDSSVCPYTLKHHGDKTVLFIHFQSESSEQNTGGSVTCSAQSILNCLAQILRHVSQVWV